MDHETNRLTRLVTLLTFLQTKRLLSATELAQRFSVSTRTIYRDIRTLEQAGVLVVTQEGKGYTVYARGRLSATAHYVYAPGSHGPAHG